MSIDALTVTYLPVRPDWLARCREEIIEPGLPIIDPHHHLWDRPGWRYMFDDLEADLGSGHNILSTVFIECHSMYRVDGPEPMRAIGETEFVNGAAAMSASGLYGPTRIASGIVGGADLRLGARVRPILEAHIRHGGDRFRGIRQIATWDAAKELLNPRNAIPKEMLRAREFREGFACLAPSGLTFDAWLYHPQIADVTDLARSFPETLIVMNHLGGPLGIGPYAGRRDEVFAQWKASVTELASCPNVFIKLGGLGMRYGGLGFHNEIDPPSSKIIATAYRPYIETCVECFGTKRCMFESNFPVDKGSFSYHVLWNAFKRLASGASAEEKADLFWRTARTFYRLA